MPLGGSLHGLCASQLYNTQKYCGTRRIFVKTSRWMFFFSKSRGDQVTVEWLVPSGWICFFLGGKHFLRSSWPTFVWSVAVLLFEDWGVLKSTWFLKSIYDVGFGNVSRGMVFLSTGVKAGTLWVVLCSLNPAKAHYAKHFCLKPWL